MSKSSSGSPPKQTAKEVERCLNCDIQTNFTANLCIECDACVDVCPVNCLTIAPDTADDFDLRAHLSAPATESDAGDLHLGAAAADEADHGQGRRRLPALRSLRRALSDGRVGHGAVRADHSVRGPYGGDAVCLSITRPASTISPSRSARSTAPARRARTVCSCRPSFAWAFRSPGKNVFPSNIQGLPTWYEIRVSKDGYTARPADVDLVVALNPDDVRERRRRRATGRIPDLRFLLAARRLAGPRRNHDHRHSVRPHVRRERSKATASARCCATSCTSARWPRCSRSTWTSSARCCARSSRRKRRCSTRTSARSGSATTTRRRTTTVPCPSASSGWTRRRTASSSTATRPPRSAPCTPARRSARGIRSRRRRR